MTATKACVPLVKTSASVSGMSVSEKECELRRNSSSTGQRSVTSTMQRERPPGDLGRVDRLVVADEDEVQRDASIADDGVEPPDGLDRRGACARSAHHLG